MQDLKVQCGIIKPIPHEYQTVVANVVIEVTAALTLREAWQLVKEPHLKEAGWWLFHTLWWSLLPVWAGLMFFYLLSQSISLSRFTDLGEFAVYSAAMLANVSHILGRELRGRTMTGRQFFTSAMNVGFACAVVLYLVAQTATTVDALRGGMNWPLLRAFTLIMFIVSTALTFFVTAFSIAIGGEDAVETVRKAQFNKLESGFEEAGDDR